MGNSSSENNEATSSERESFLDMLPLFAMPVFVLGLYLYDITLIVLAAIVTLGSIAVGVFLILRSYANGDTKFRVISGEIEHLSNDASFDISEELIYWDKLKYTKGIGTKIEGQNRDIEDIHHRLVIARDELTQATTPVHRIEAVLTADSVLAIAQELRKPAQS